ncbi:MAG: hypothetical protein K2P66_05745 [Lachnospiraceae bacterium]|nr:hypothetical protein [Lachnospiraceae bacterium]
MRIRYSGLQAERTTELEEAGNRPFREGHGSSRRDKESSKDAEKTGAWSVEEEEANEYNNAAVY